MSTALGADWKIVVDFWRLGECFWKVRWVCGGVRKEDCWWWISGRKLG